MLFWDEKQWFSRQWKLKIEQQSHCRKKGDNDTWQGLWHGIFHRKVVEQNQKQCFRVTSLSCNVSVQAKARREDPSLLMPDLLTVEFRGGQNEQWGYPGLRVRLFFPRFPGASTRLHPGVAVDGSKNEGFQFSLATVKDKVTYAAAPSSLIIWTRSLKDIG